MRQVGWNEMFNPRASDTFALAPQVPQVPTGWRRLLWWEDWLTFGLLALLYISVVASIQTAGWVDDMPALTPIGLFGLALAVVLSRLRWPEGFIHLVALPIGAAAILAQLLWFAEGSSPVQRFENITTRMGAWFDAAFTGGISNDSLPFIMVVVCLTWLGAYMSAWAVFRWQNAWLALLPGGTALMVNLGFQSAGFSVAVVVYLFAAALLLTRMHLTQQAQAWRERGTPYPPLLSLSVLHATFWVAALLLIVSWMLPPVDEVRPLASVWERATDPAIERAAEFSRLFVSVRGGGSDELLRRYGNVVPFRGAIDLSDQEVLDLITEELEQPYYLRGDVYQIYTPEGWHQDADETRHLGSEAQLEGAFEDFRNEINVQIVPQGNTSDTLFSIGPPTEVDRRSEARTGSSFPNDVVSLENAGGRLKSGQDYSATGSVSIATEDDLRAAGTQYPFVIADRYTDLPDDLPERVRELGVSVAAEADNPYDQATAIERYLRANYAYTLEPPDVPLGRDAIDFFLFDSQEGYFDYHASAMVVMLRANDIPSRLVIGYVLNNGQDTPRGERFLVTEANAFAWPEAYFPGLGWVEFNPSPAPGLGPIQRPGNAPGEVIASGDTTDADPQAAGDFPLDFPQEGAGVRGALPEAGGGGNGNWIVIGLLGGLGALVLLGAGGLRFAWVRGLSGLDEPARLWGQTQRLASWARVPVAGAQTPREFSAQLRNDVPGTDEVDTLADAYVRQRYGRWQPDDADREQLEGAWQSVRAGLLRWLLRPPWAR